jgi:YtkA-like protein
MSVLAGSCTLPLMSHSQRLALALASVLMVTAGAIAAAAGAFGSNSPASPPSFIPPSVVGRVGPGRVATSLRAHGYRIDLRLSPNRASAARGQMSVKLSQNGQPVSGAQIRLTFTMLDMKMDGLLVTLRQTAPGRYDRVTQRLMFGRWGLRVAVMPTHERTFSVNLVDRVGI